MGKTNESNAPTDEQKKEIKKQVKKETRRFKRKTIGTLGILVLLVGIIILLLASNSLGLFGNGSGFGNGEGIIGSIKDKVGELKGDVSEVDSEEATDNTSEDATTETTTDDEASEESTENVSDEGEGADTSEDETATTEDGGEMVMEATISETQIIYNGTTYEDAEAFKAAIGTYEYEEGEQFNIIGVNGNIKTYEAVKSIIEEMKLVPNYVDDATLE